MIQFLNDHNLLGLTIGACTFLIIGLFHPLVIKGEYYFGLTVRWAFLILGIATCVASYFVSDVFWSTILGVIAFSSFWSIKEVNEQKERVAKGWFPANPRRNKTGNPNQPIS